MPKLYVFDPEPDDRRRWEEMLPAFEYAVITPTGRQFVADGEPVKEGIIVIHRSEFGEERVTDIHSWCSDNPQLVFIVISGSPQDETYPGLGKAYFRRSPVSKNDDTFKECFALFWTGYRKQNKSNFRLLEATAVPEPMLSYLLAVYYRLQLPEASLSRLRAAADADYERLHLVASSRLSGPRVALAERNEVDPLPPRGAFLGETVDAPQTSRFSAMMRMVESLREDL